MLHPHFCLSGVRWVHSQFNAKEAENMKSGTKSAVIAAVALLLTAPAWSASRDDNAREEVTGTEEAVLTDAPLYRHPYTAIMQPRLSCI
jgi:hypothetical protein